MTTVIYYPDAREPDFEIIEADTVLGAIRGIWPMDVDGIPSVPPTIELYDQHYSQDCLIDPARWGEINGEKGPFILVNQPADPATWTVAGVLQVIAAITAVAAIVLAPEPPTTTQRTIRKESPNNGLSGRTNQERINGRIPEIVGTVRSTPDLLSVPYLEFINHVEVEIAYMAIGRGRHETPANQVRDGSTKASEIAGMSVEVFGPYTSPNSGTPQLRIGNAINRPVLTVQRLDAVNGQVMQPANAGGVWDRPIVFNSPNLVTVQDSGIDLTELFISGEEVTISGAAQTEGRYSYSVPNDSPAIAGYAGSDTYELRLVGNFSSEWTAGQQLTITNGRVTWVIPGGGDAGNDQEMAADISGVYTVAGVSFDSVRTRINLGRANQVNSSWNSLPPSGGERVATGTPTLSRPSGNTQFNLSGTYYVNTVTASQLILNDPAAVNSDWNRLASDFGGQSNVLTVSLSTSGQRYAGWFMMSFTQPPNQLIANFVALNGLYKDNGRQQYRVDVMTRLEAVPVDSDGNEVGGIEAWEQPVVGSATSRSTRAYTYRVGLGATSLHWKFRARRTSPTDKDFNGSVVDEVKWRDLYAAATVNVPHFGDVTTAHVVTLATDGALAVKERKFNLLVTRMLPRWLGGTNFTSELFPTRSAADILAFLSLDPHIGNRSAQEVDFDNIYQTIEDIRGYFGFPEAADFSYTFDDNNMSFEETVYAIASALGCQAYRQGSKIRLHFERENPNSSLLFNHRNKIPGSETRTVEFGRKSENYDGIEYQYISPDDDGPATFYIPADRSAINPKVIESVGVRNIRQAHIHAWRAWNKIRYQNTTVEFTGLREASPLILSNRISVADNTRSGAMDGEIRGVEGLELYLSQPMPWTSGTVIEIQNDDGQTEIIPVTRGRSDRHALLSRAPRTPINFSGNEYVRTVFAMATDERKPEPFLVTEKGEQEEDGTTPITAINYDGRYYERDRDFGA